MEFVRQGRSHELALMEAAGAVRFLSAYPPDLRPIEMMVEIWLQSADARTHLELLNAIATALPPPEDLRGWFAARGYSII